MLYKSKLLTLGTIGYSWFILMMSIVVWAQVAVLLMYMSYDVVWNRLCTLGRAPRTKETLPDFHE